jgi:hypothetical protein
VKLKVFFASDGDCLLLTSADGRHVLIDGGRSGTFQSQAWPLLRSLADAGEEIDLVVVSHIDADHISGVLWLMKVVADWTLHDYQTGEGGNPGFRKPSTPRPPVIKRLWHNSWRAQLGALAGPIEAYASRIEDGIQAGGVGLSRQDAVAVKAITALQDLAESIPDGVELLRVVDDGTPVPRNQGFERELVMLRKPAHVETVGSTQLTVIGPARKHLEKLRQEWRDWIEAMGPGTTERGGSHGREPELVLGGGGVADDQEEVERLVSSLAATARIIADTDPSKVTPPNRASITLLAEEGDATCLLTGDAAEDEIVEGLKAAGRMKRGRFHCDVLKVQHHGSEHNVSAPFARKVLADHYVFCADGAHENPNPSVVKTIAETRSDASDRPFTIWFNASPSRTIKSRRPALKAAIDEAMAAAAQRPGITVNVLDDREPFFELDIPEKHP